MDTKHNTKTDPFLVDDDNPLWTPKDFKNARPGREVFAELGMVAPVPKRGRPKMAHPKVQITVRLDEDILAAFKREGKGWNTRLNQVLRTTLHL